MSGSTLTGFPLSPQQRRLWRLAEGAPAAPFRAGCRVRLEGALDQAALHAALAQVVARHEILRTRFASLPGLALPVQVPGAADDPAAAQLAAALAPAGGGAFVLDLQLPALCADEATLQLLVAELATAYGRVAAPVQPGGAAAPAATMATMATPATAAATATAGMVGIEADAAAAGGADSAADGEPEPLTYAQFAEWQNDLIEGEDAAAGRELWREQRLAEVAPPRLPLAADAPAKDFAPRVVAVQLDADLAARAAAAAEAAGVAFERYLLAAWAVLLWRHTGCGDLVIGRLAAGRDHELLAGACGPLARLLPERVALAPDLPFGEILRRLTAWQEATEEWQESFAFTDAWPDETAAVAVGYSWHEAAPPPSPAAGVRFAVEHLAAQVERCDLLLAVRPGDAGLALALHHDAARLAADGVAALGRCLTALLGGAAADAERPIGLLPLLTEAEVRQIAERSRAGARSAAGSARSSAAGAAGAARAGTDRSSAAGAAGAARAGTDRSSAAGAAGAAGAGAADAAGAAGAGAADAAGAAGAGAADAAGAAGAGAADAAGAAGAGAADAAGAAGAGAAGAAGAAVAAIDRSSAAAEGAADRADTAGVPAALLVDLPLHRLLEAQAARTPDRFAVAPAAGAGSAALLGDSDARGLTFGDLNARANRLARCLRRRGVGPETPVGLLLPRSCDQMVALWAVLKAGGAVLPLDPAAPPARLAALLDAAGAPLVLAAAGPAAPAAGSAAGIGADAASAAGRARLLDLGALAAEMAGEDPANLEELAASPSTSIPQASTAPASAGAVAVAATASPPAAPSLAAPSPAASSPAAPSPAAPSLAAPVPAVPARPASGAGLDNLAYVIFTSGSTGVPKGVLVEHRAALDLVRALAAAIPPYGQGRPLRASVNAPLTFDASVKQWLQVLCGHTLQLVPDEVRLDAPRLVDFLRRQQVDVLDCTPSQLRLLLAAGLGSGAADPRAVLVGGEAIDGALWRRMEEVESAGPTRFYNVYGPTECTVDTTAQARAGAGPRPALGGALPGAAILVVDRLRLPDPVPVPAGFAGELWVGGSRLARGYLGQPAATADRFRPDPWAATPGARAYRTGDLVRRLPDDRLEFIGRADRQIKVRGFRIELEEIEAALAAHPAVRQAAVVVLAPPPADTAAAAAAPPAAGGGGEQLAAYVALHAVRAAHGTPTVEPPARMGDVMTGRAAAAPAGSGGHAAAGSAIPVAAGTPAPAAAELRAWLRERLPEPMVPAFVVTLPELPVTARGKVDHRALPDARQAAAARAAVAYTAPRNQAERTVAAVWQEVLGVPVVGVDDNFFDLGGHSLLMVRAHGRLQEELGRQLSMVEMFRFATVGALAEYLVRGEERELSLDALRARAGHQRQGAERQRRAAAAVRRPFAAAAEPAGEEPPPAGEAPDQAVEDEEVRR